MRWHGHGTQPGVTTDRRSDLGFPVEAMGLEPTNLLTASQALYQLSYAPEGDLSRYQSVSATLRARPRVRMRLRQD